jgi:hypothetical protein
MPKRSKLLPGISKDPCWFDETDIGPIKVCPLQKQLNKKMGLRKR